MALASNILEVSSINHVVLVPTHAIGPICWLERAFGSIVYYLAATKREKHLKGRIVPLLDHHLGNGSFEDAIRLEAINSPPFLAFLQLDFR